MKYFLGIINFGSINKYLSNNTSADKFDKLSNAFHQNGKVNSKDGRLGRNGGKNN